MDTTPSLIAIDWGTSNFRAFLLDQQGNVLEKKFAKLGILKISRGYFEQHLAQQISDWTQKYPNIPILMSGMIGSRQGWIEVPYLSCPVDLKELAQNLVQANPNKNQWIVPGLRINYPDGKIDVMRGEETQILGALKTSNSSQQVFCLPGTHCKWAWTVDERITEFTTFMTGEIFTLLAKHSILGKLLRSTRTDMQAFDRGMDWSEREEHMLSQIFQVRTQVLGGKLNPHSVHSFLSGLLIGHEIRQVLRTPIVDKKVTLVANARISRLYSRALARNGIDGFMTDSDNVTTQGLFRIATHAGILQRSMIT